ncbi:hypothetical protein AmDm5_2179 [Acetobacter malorum]|nr:hypothetical protein AmDm5_2179 [Acetobacter malorum]
MCEGQTSGSASHAAQTCQQAGVQSSDNALKYYNNFITI